MIIGKTARIVNTALDGEPENIAFQILETKEIVQFSDIKFKVINGVFDAIEDELSFSHPYIQDVYWNKGHECKISLDTLGNSVILL
jgi:hypothetical protein